MFAATSIKRTARIISVFGTVSTSLLMAGCTDDAIESAVEGIFTVPQTEVTDDINETPQDVQPPVFVEPEPPVTVEPEPPTFVDAEPPVNVEPEPPIFVEPEPPVEEELPGGVSGVSLDPETTPDIGSGTGSATFQALQRLQPGTLFDYTVTADGSTFSAFFDFSNITLIDEGEDSLLTLTFDDGGFLFCGFTVGSYICVDVFPEGNAFLDLFTLDANNTGDGIFALCPEFLLDIDSCLNTLFESPAGTSVVTAGQPVAFTSSELAYSHNEAGPEYMQYLAESEPAVSNRSSEDFSELTEKLRTLIELSITQ